MSTTNTPTSFIGKHIFTQEEKNQKTEQMLQAMRQKEEIEAEFKTSKSNYKSKIDSKEAEIKLTANLLNAGFEDRTYSCLLTKDFEAGKRLYHEIGSNKLVGEEPLTAGDYQTQMNLEEATIRKNNELADLAQELLHSGDPDYKVEPDSNPLEFEEAPADLFEPPIDEDAPTEENEWQPDFKEETPAVEPEVIKEPTKAKEVKSKVVKIDPTPEPIEGDPFGMDDDDEQEDDPFSFSDI